MFFKWLESKSFWLHAESKRFGCEWQHSRCILPSLQTLAVKAVVTQGGQHTVDGLVHALQTHGALGQLNQIHHR